MAAVVTTLDISSRSMTSTKHRSNQRYWFNNSGGRGRWVNTRMTRVFYAGLLVLLVFLSTLNSQQLVEGTFFIIGLACNAALSVALKVAGDQLGELGLEAPLETVQGLCKFIERNSLPVLAARAIRPQISALITFIQTGQLALPGGIEEFGERLNNIAQLTIDFDLDI